MLSRKQLDKFVSRIKDADTYFRIINFHKYELGRVMLELKPYFQEPKIQEQYGTWKQYLAENGYAERQINPIMNAVHYLNINLIDFKEFLNVPLQKFRLYHDLGVEWNEESEADLILNYVALKQKYDNTEESGGDRQWSEME